MLVYSVEIGLRGYRTMRVLMRDAGPLEICPEDIVVDGMVVDQL